MNDFLIWLSGFAVGGGLVWFVQWVSDGQDESRESDKYKNALQQLVDLKEHKDKYGKDDVYKINQPLVWEHARKVLEYD